MRAPEALGILRGGARGGRFHRVSGDDSEPRGGGAPAASATGHPRARRIAVTAMVVAAAVCAFLSVFALWADRQAIESDGWESTARELVDDPVVQEALAGYLTDELYRLVDVGALVEDALPPEFRALAAPAAAAARQAVERGAEEALERPRVQTALTLALARAHDRAVALLRDEGTLLSTGGGEVVLELNEVLGRVVERVGVGERLEGALPPDAGRIVLLRSDQLGRSQQALRALESIALLLPVLALGLLAGGLWLAEGRRREALRLAGICLIIAALAVPVTRALIGDIVIGAVDPAPAYEPAAERTYTIATSMLREGAIALLIYGIIILAGALLAGPSRAGRGIRRALSGVSDPHVAYPAGAVLLGLILWWGPTQGLRRPFSAILLLALLAAGLEILRRQIAREAAEAPNGPEGQALGQRMRYALGRIRAPRPRASQDPGEVRLEALERAQRLRAEGVLTEEEFAAEKRRIMGGEDA
jgi:hypothetical protein